ncbi:MAG: hypothetical protein GY858_02300, partial [Candidatus Omnitrophica bacterium]|nr:hypothetical protein [Candidatus Omnitrophota bacterium]
MFDTKDSAVLSFFKCLAMFIICQEKGYPKLKSVVYCVHRAKSVYREAVRIYSPTPLLDCISLVRDFMLYKLSAYFSVHFVIWGSNDKGCNRYPIYQSNQSFFQTKMLPSIHIFLWQKEQYCLIVNIDSFRNQWGCYSCRITYHSRNAFNLHLKCYHLDANEKFPELAEYRGYKCHFPGRIYRPNTSIIEDLELINIFLPNPSLVLNPYMLIFDIKSLLPHLTILGGEDVDEIAQWEDFYGMILGEIFRCLWQVIFPVL